MILITRPKAAAKIMANHLGNLGFTTKCFPLLEIQPMHFLIGENPRHILISSSNAIHALEQFPNTTKITVIGHKTAERIKQKGFSIANVFETSDELIKKFKTDEEILFLSGDHIATNLSAHLKTIKRIPVYKSVAKSTLPANLLQEVDVITFYSPRTAETFANLNHADLTDIIAICISNKTAQKLDGLNFKKVIIAKAPNEDEVVEAIKQNVGWNKQN